MTDREEIRQHLVAAHHWPAVAHYEATATDLDELHVLCHDPTRRDQAVARIRSILNMPDEDADE